MIAKNKMEVKNLMSDRIMDIVKKLENNIQNKSSSVDDEGKSKEILMGDVFFNLINNQNISKIKKNKKKLYFLIIK